MKDKQNSKPSVESENSIVTNFPNQPETRVTSKPRISKKTLNEPCKCGLTPAHVKGEHDACCQICGGNHTERICPQQTLEGKKAKVSAKLKMPNIKLCKCLNPQCGYYKKRHRRFVWSSKTTLAKPSCPKCFSHRTQVVAIAVFKLVKSKVKS